MVEEIDDLLVVMGIVAVVAVISARIRIPFPILLVIAGLGIAFVPGIAAVHLDPELVFFIILPPLLFSAAWNFPWDDFRANLLPIFAMAVGLVFATLIGVGIAAVWLIPGLTLAGGFVLGAIVAPPDAVAATTVLKNVRIPRRLKAILEGESLVNDSSGLIAYQFAVAAVVTGSFSLWKAAGEFVWTSAGGVLLGLVVGAAAARLHQFLRDPAVEITLTILTPYLAYLSAEKLGFSGVLAVVTAGLHVGHRAWEALSTGSRLQRDAIWQFLDYLLNSIVFLAIGLQFPSIVEGLSMPLWKMILVGSAVSLVLIVIRFLWVIPLSWLQGRCLRHSGARRTAASRGGIIVASWAGMRGVVSLAAALALPLTTASGEPFPHRHGILFITFCVIFITLVLQGLSLPWLARTLKIEEYDSDLESETKARIALLEGLIADVAKLESEEAVPEHRESLAMWRGHYQNRLERLRHQIAMPRDVHQYSRKKEFDLFPGLMRQVRQRMADMRAQGLITEEIRRRIERDFDMEEDRINRFLARFNRD